MEPEPTRLNLAAIRRNRGLSLDDIAERTKIATRYLSAIERENFSVLPGLVYSVSYIRQYASAIQYDARTILLVYRECVPEEAPPDAAVPVPSLPDGGADPLWSTVRRAFVALIGNAQ